MAESRLTRRQLLERMGASVLRRAPHWRPTVSATVANRAAGRVASAWTTLAGAPLDFLRASRHAGVLQNLLRPALEAVGLPASRPATKDAPAVRGVRLRDLRHAFAPLQPSSGVHFYAGVKVVRAQHFYADSGRLRRLHQ